MESAKELLERVRKFTMAGDSSAGQTSLQAGWRNADESWE
jgi:hypothetical protein